MSDLSVVVLSALRQVHDPETGRDLVAMGLIRAVDAQGGRVTVVMTTTTPGCPLADALKAGVAAAVRRVPGVAGVEVHLTWDPPWTPASME